MAGKKIIIVEDKLSYRTSLRKILDVIGNCEVVGEAVNGAEYLELIRSVKPDITFMDIEMPIMDGIEATRRALQIQKDLVIIGLSLYPNDQYINNLLDAGAKGYMLKMDDNLDLIKTIIANPHAEIFFSNQVKEKIQKRENQKTIMIVDDFETNLIVIESALVNAGYKVLKAKSGEDALKQAMNTKDSIDLIVADYNMPVMNGAELVSRIKKLPKYTKTPVIMLSSDESTEKRALAKEAGAVGWMKKPFVIDKFLKIVGSLF
jgi:CheY-like chemotaxis protein